MKCSRPLAAIGAGGLVVATLLTALPATAATAQAASTAAAHQARSDSTTSDRVRIQRTGSMVTLTVAAPAGHTVTVRDGSNAVSGARSTEGTATLTLRAPERATAYTVDDITGGTTSIGQVTLDGTTDGTLEAPTVAHITNDGKRATATITGEPGAIVTVTDDAATVIGLKMLGRTGSAFLSLAGSAEKDEKLSVSQKIGNDISDEAPLDIAAPAKVEVGHIASDAAVVAFTGVTGTNWSLTVFDGSGKAVAGGRFLSSGATTRVLPITPGTINRFTVRRGDPGGPWSSDKKFDVDSTTGAASMPDPTVRFLGNAGSGPLVRFGGIPGALITVHDAANVDHPLLVDSFNADGMYLDTQKRLKPSTAYTVTQSVGSDSSQTVEFTTPS